MHRILVEEKRWIGEARFLHALNYCMLLPGPEAQQLAIYIGWLMHRTAGGMVAGGLFVLPGFVAIMALSCVYAAFGKVGMVAGAVLRPQGGGARHRARGGGADRQAGAEEPVLVAHRRRRPSSRIFFFGVPFPLIVLPPALIGYLGARAGRPAFAPAAATAAAKADAPMRTACSARSCPHATAVLAAALRVGAGCGWCSGWCRSLAFCSRWGRGNVFSQMRCSSRKMAVVTFGGAYAVLAYVAQQAVEIYHWLQPGEMLDGLGMAETTPGPLIMVLQFVGFLAAFRDAGALPPLLAGALGGLLTTWVTFVPCFLWIFLGAPFIETLRGNKALVRRALGDHRRGRRRDPQPGGLVRAPHPIRAK